MTTIDFATLSKANLFQDWMDENLNAEQQEDVWRWINALCKKLDIFTSEAMALLAEIFVLVEPDGQTA